MKNYTILLIALLITSCRHIVVWNAGEFMALALFLVVGLLYMVLWLWQKVGNWFKKGGRDGH